MALAPSGRLERPRLYVQLADHIARFIEAQGLSPGDRLPPERRLLADLDDLLSEAAPLDDAQISADRLTALARAVVVGDAATACAHLLQP
jgi:hypothetical protein